MRGYAREVADGGVAIRRGLSRSDPGAELAHALLVGARVCLVGGADDVAVSWLREAAAILDGAPFPGNAGDREAVEDLLLRYG